MEKDKLFELSRKNLEWLRENYEDLRRKYDNQWIIVQRKKVVAASSTYDSIVNLLEKADDPKSAIVEFMDSKQMAMFF